MARIKGAPYYLRSVDGRAILEFRTTDGQRKVRLGCPFDPDRSNATERRAAQQAAETKWRELTAERVVTEHARVKTTQTLSELYARYIDRWEPPEGLKDENERKRLLETLVVRRAYGWTMARWASDEATRGDGTKRWKGDTRTPLERLVADEGPRDFLAWRLTRVKRNTMRREKSNLVQFLEWSKAHGYLASLPTVDLPPGNGVAAIEKSGRGVNLPLTPVEARCLIEVMPEWSVGRTAEGGKGVKDQFLVRSFFEFMWLTGLRPATLQRLEIGRNWLRGARELRLENTDDKAKYGRSFPLTKMAMEILERIAPDDGHIWGHHDRRAYVKDAAAIVFAKDAHRRDLFGSYHLRHFVGTFLANRAGTNLAAAQFVMGHLDLSTTSTYVHPDKEAARALLEATEGELRKAAKEAQKWAKKAAGRR